MKYLFSVLLISLLNFNVLSSPKFGGAIDSDGAFGLIVSDNSYKAAFSYQQLFNINGLDAYRRILTFGVDYKKLIQPKTFLTIGARYQMIEDKAIDDDDSDENQNTALSVGLEYFLDKNLFIFGSSDLISIATIDDGIADQKSALNFARIGIGYLF